MKAAKGTFGSCWRRRTLTNRILPAILQAVIVVASWEALKKLVPSSNEDGDNVSTKNARSFDQTKCPDTDISHAATLSLLDLGSLITEVSSRDRPVTFHLKVDIYVRDEKHDLILYPAGTLINFGDIKKRLAAEIRPYEKQDYSIDNEADNKGDVKTVGVDIDTKDDAAYSAKDTSVKKSDSLSTGKGSASQVYFDYASEKADSQMSNEGEYETDAEKPGRVQDQVVRFKPEVERSQKSNLEIKVAQNLQESMAHNFLNSKIPQSSKKVDTVKMALNKAPSDPLKYLRMLNQNLANGLASGGAPQINVGGIDARQLGIPPNVIPDYSNNLGYQNQNIPSNLVAQNSDSKILTRGVLVDETGEFLYAEGFLDRVSKLSSELFGNVKNNGSTDEAQINVLMNNPNACLGLKDIDVLFLINSVPQNADQRQRIRDTFVSPSYFKDFKIVHVFLVGKTTSPNVQQKLNQEQELYHDIIQGDIYDTPENATLKGLMGMRWVTQFCFLAKYIMKINEGVFVDTDKLIRGLIPAAKKISGKRVILCYFNPESAISRSGPNAVPEDLFPGRTRLRPYCKGFAVLMTRGVISSLLAAFEYVQPIHLDELYLYGILPFVSGNVDVFDVGSNRAFHNFGMETVNCYKQLLDKCPFVASVAFNERFTNLWEFVKNRMQTPHQGWENARSLWNVQDYKRRF